MTVNAHYLLLFPSLEHPEGAGAGAGAGHCKPTSGSKKVG